MFKTKVGKLEYFNSPSSNIIIHISYMYIQDFLNFCTTKKKRRQQSFQAFYL